MLAPTSAPPSAAPPTPTGRARFGPGWWVAIVGTGIFALVTSLAVIAYLGWFLFGGLFFWEDDYSGIEDEAAEGIVVDASGAEVPGVGTFDRPATAGEHSLVWDTPQGTTTVGVTGADWDAAPELEAAGSSVTPAPDGFVYVLVDVRVDYEGQGELDLVSDLWFDVETWEDFSPSQYGPILPEGTLQEAGVVRSGESAAGQVLFLVRESEVDEARISVGTYDGWSLYVAEG